MRLAARVIAGLAVACLLGAAIWYPFRGVPRALQDSVGDPIALSIYDFAAADLAGLPMQPTCSGPQALCTFLSGFLVCTVLAAFALCQARIWHRGRLGTAVRVVRAGLGLGVASGLLLLLSQTQVLEAFGMHMPGDSGWAHPVVLGTLWPVLLCVIGMVVSLR